MTCFYSVTNFRASVKKLLKEREYNSLMVDIVNSFKGKSIEEIRQNSVVILIEESHVFVKARMSNSSAKYSKAKGWRVIYCVSKKTDVVYLLYVYPKKGRHALDNISVKEFKDLMSVFLTECKNGTMVQHDSEDMKEI